MCSRRHQKGRIGADILYKQEFLSYIVFFMCSRRHQKGHIDDKINVIELQRCYFGGKWEYYRGCR